MSELIMCKFGQQTDNGRYYLLRTLETATLATLCVEICQINDFFSFFLLFCLISDGSTL